MRKLRTIRHFDEPGHAHELTFSCIEMLPLLASDAVCEWLAQSINGAREKHGFHVWAYVFMPNHVHLLIFPLGEKYSTKGILQSIKQPVGRRFMNRVKQLTASALSGAEESALNRSKFWQDGPGHDRNVTEFDTVHFVIDYIHNNPIRKGLVSEPEDWPWSSARAWAGLGDSPISIDREFVPPKAS